MKDSSNTYLNRFYWLALRTNIAIIRNTAWSAIEPKAYPFYPEDSAARILVGGDVCLDTEIRILPYLGARALRGPYDPIHEIGPHQSVSVSRVKKAGIIRRARNKFSKMVRKIYRNYFLPPEFVPNPDQWEVFRELVHTSFQNPEQIFLPSIYERFVRFSITYPSDVSASDYPFTKIASFMKERDFVLVNLETPLTRHPRAYGLFASDPAYAMALKKAGISMVSLANNHMFDAGEIGFMDTMEHLSRAGIPFVGAGKSLDEARSGRVEVIRGIRIAFLSYTQWCNLDFASIAAEYPGILPMDRQIMTEDIKAAKKTADYVFVSLHWGLENEPIPDPKQTEIAHHLIDHGADVIIGNHAHIPQAIEIYRGRPIFYCLGNLIFGSGDTKWLFDNYLAEIVIDQKGIQGVIVHPVSGINEELFQPEILKGTRAKVLLRTLQLKSAFFRTGIYIKEDKGYIRIRDEFPPSQDIPANIRT